MLRSVAIRVQSPGEPQAQVEASMQNTMPIPLLRHVVAMTNLAFPVGFHSVSMESARQAAASAGRPPGPARSEEHTSELQSLMRISYAVFCLKKKSHYCNPTHAKNINHHTNHY